MRENLKNFEWLLLLKWVIVNSASIIIGGLAILIFLGTLDSPLEVTAIWEIVAIGLATFLIGIINGAGQTLFFNSILRKRIGWIIATGTGWAVGPTLLRIVTAILPQSTVIIDLTIINELLFDVSLVALFGLSIGFFQILVLRKAVSIVSPWLLVNTIAFPLALITTELLEDIIPYYIILCFSCAAPSYIEYREHIILAGALAILSLTTGLGYLWIKSQYEIDQFSALE